MMTMPVVKSNKENKMKLKMHDDIMPEWVNRERINWAMMQVEHSNRDLVERETPNYYVIPADHMAMVVPDSWADVREGEGMLREEMPQQVFRKTSAWEMLAWNNAIDTDDFEKGPALEMSQNGELVLAPNDAWEVTIDNAMEYASFGDRMNAV